MTATPPARQGLKQVRKAYWSGFQITVAGAARVAGDIVGGDLKLGHIVQVDPFDLDNKGLGVSVCRPTSNFLTKLFVVTGIGSDVNEVITDVSLGAQRRRGGWIEVTPCDGNVDARVNGVIAAAAVGLDAGRLCLDNTAGYEQYMNLIAGSPTTVAHQKTFFAAPGSSNCIAVAMAAKAGAAVALSPVQFGGMWDQVSQ